VRRNFIKAATFHLRNEAILCCQLRHVRLAAAARARVSLHTTCARPSRQLCGCVDLSKVQDDEVGDGTTSVAVLAGELLREAERLINQKLHPMTIIQGFRLACEVSLEVLDERKFDNASNPEQLREDLINIARTTLSSKILTVDKEYFAKIAVDAVMCLKGRTNLEPIHVIKKAGGTLKDSFLAEARLLLRMRICDIS
jgi:chaperonin GroEL (HSP60 family)